MGSGEQWRLGYRPALDGLRGVAILLVVAAHLDIDWLAPLGGTGVTVFFTLSGFLITALLLSELSKSGRVSMSIFYRRRFFRLAPAFIVMLAVVVPIEFALYGEAPYWWATVLEVGNWVSATQGADAPQLLHHTWSLAIEEQFYIVWPVALWLSLHVGGRRGVVLTIGAGMVMSLVAASSVDGARLAYGTDTNAFALLAGCLLALLMVDRRLRPAPWFAVPAAGMVLVAGAAVGGLLAWPAVPVATTLAIWAGATRSVGWLEWAPLRGAGRISYGWYLWNYPVAVLAIIGGLSMVTVPFVSLGLALVSWRYVEQPFLRLGASSASKPALPSLTQFQVSRRIGVHRSEVQNDVT